MSRYPAYRKPPTKSAPLDKIVGANSQLYLRDKAQEYTAKDLAKKGDLNGLRYLVFSTHGLLGGEFLAVQQAQNHVADLESRTSLSRPSPSKNAANRRWR